MSEGLKPGGLTPGRAHNAVAGLVDMYRGILEDQAREIEGLRGLYEAQRRELDGAKKRIVTFEVQEKLFKEQIFHLGKQLEGLLPEEPSG